MSADPIDDLAERLFASARGERASARLVQRVLADVTTRDEHPGEIDRRSMPARVRVTRPWPHLLIAAAACMVAGVSWSTIERARQAPTISAEVAPRGEHAPGAAEHVDTQASAAPAVSSAPPVATDAPDVENVPHAATPRALDEPASTPRRRPASRRPPHGTPARPAVTVPSAPSAEPVPAPTAPGPTGSVTPEAHRAADTAPAPPSLSHELQALERARAALRGGDGRAALRLLDADGEGARFTRLADEATLLRIEALYAVGELAESRRLAEEFTTKNPDSHLGDRARSFIHRVDAIRNATGSSAPR